ncbi:MAG: ABC transporter substrate-binding protein [Anaerolineae bacterium]|jgi:putative spermidine/putrescine transport system substrate-binding protein|nr:ABC transporter substrate-binding protein [Anaerolineae bacterium]
MRFWWLLLLLLATFSVDAQTEEAPQPLPAPPGFESWQAVLDQARGTTIYWYVWGGSEAINAFIDTFYGEPLLEEYGITLERVPVVDTVDVVNLILSEQSADIIDTGGVVDLIWINGENFATLKQADMLYQDWAETIPNSVLVNWEDPAIAYDFGVPVEGDESPWSSAQLHFIYDSARMSEDQLPSNYDELTVWIEQNPGRFTYIAPGPGAFQGTRFVKQVLYHVSGGYEQWVGPWNPTLYAEWAPRLWDYLNVWETNLWRGGETYPATENELLQLFANGEVDFALTQATSGAETYISQGLIPETSRAFTLTEYAIGDYNYVAIPRNATNKAAALIVANLLLRPDRQAGHILPESGFGLGYAISLDRVNEEDRALLEASLAQLGETAADPAALAAAFAPDLAPESQSVIEQDWEANVLR